MILKGTKAEFEDRVTELTACCLHPSDVVKVDQLLAWNNGCSCWPKACNTYCEGWELAIFTTGGMYYVLSAWEDTSGHGCQCGSQISMGYQTLENAVTVGLTDEEQKKLGVVPILSMEQQASLLKVQELLDAGADPSDPRIDAHLKDAGILKETK